MKRIFWLMLLVTTTGCSTLASLGLPFGAPSNKILDSAKSISAAPGLPIDTPKELAKRPLDVYIVEVGDTLFTETISFDASIRLPGDQVVKPDGTISIGEFGNYYAANKTVDEIRTGIQETIDENIRQDLLLAFEEEIRDEEVRVAKNRQRTALENEGASNRRSTNIGPDSRQENDLAIDQQTAEASAELLQEKRQALERRIAEQIKENQITVRLVNWDSKRIYVLGEVNSPGFFPYSGNQTVLDAVVEAGGLTARANHHQIIVSRLTSCGSCRIVMQTCYDQIVQLGDASTNYLLLPGDRVFVASLTFADDLKKTFSKNGELPCPRCAACPKGCKLPTECR